MPNDTEPKRYTLAEAQGELGRRECRAYGHSFSISEIQRFGGATVALTINCSRCGWSGRCDMIGQDPSRPRAEVST